MNEPRAVEFPQDRWMWHSWWCDQLNIASAPNTHHACSSASSSWCQTSRQLSVCLLTDMYFAKHGDRWTWLNKCFYLNYRIIHRRKFNIDRRDYFIYSCWTEIVKRKSPNENSVIISSHSCFSKHVLLWIHLVKHADCSFPFHWRRTELLNLKKMQKPGLL